MNGSDAEIERAARELLKHIVFSDPSASADSLLAVVGSRCRRAHRADANGRERVLAAMLPAVHPTLCRLLETDPDGDLAQRVLAAMASPRVGDYLHVEELLCDPLLVQLMSRALATVAERSEDTVVRRMAEWGRLRVEGIARAPGDADDMRRGAMIRMSTRWLDGPSCGGPTIRSVRWDVPMGVSGDLGGEATA